MQGLIQDSLLENSIVCSNVSKLGGYMLPQEILKFWISQTGSGGFRELYTTEDITKIFRERKPQKREILF